MVGSEKVERMYQHGGIREGSKMNAEQDRDPYNLVAFSTQLEPY
jgi:hypothetical protein